MSGLPQKKDSAYSYTVRGLGGRVRRYKGVTPGGLTSYYLLQDRLGALVYFQGANWLGFDLNPITNPSTHPLLCVNQSDKHRPKNDENESEESHLRTESNKYDITDRRHGSDAQEYSLLRLSKSTKMRTPIMSSGKKKGGEWWGVAAKVYVVTVVDVYLEVARA